MRISSSFAFCYRKLLSDKFCRSRCQLVRAYCRRHHQYSALPTLSPSTQNEIQSGTRSNHTNIGGGGVRPSNLSNRLWRINKQRTQSNNNYLQSTSAADLYDFTHLRSFSSQPSSSKNGESENRPAAAAAENSNSENNESTEKIVTIPNLLCVGRIVAAPVIACLVLQHSYGAASILFVASGCTDLVDGYIARNWPGQMSNVGSVLDPLADKVLVGTLFMALTLDSLIPAGLTALVIARDVILVLYSFVCRYKLLEPPKTWQRYWDPNCSTVRIKPTNFSKLNTGLQLLTAASTLGCAAMGLTDTALLQTIWTCTAVSTVGSGLQYLFFVNHSDTVDYLKTKRRLK